MDDYTRSTLERAHSQGARFRKPVCHPLWGEVNQTLQNTGIEMFLREMEKAKPKGVTYHPVTNTKVHPNSRRLSLIEYSIDIEYKGVRRLGFQVAIGVSDDIRAPRVWIDKSLSHINPDPAVLEFLPIGDLPKSIQMFSGRIMGP